MQLDLVRVARQDKQLAVAVFGARHLRVPVLRIEEDPVCLAAEPGERVEEEERMAERRAVGRIQAVRVLGPVCGALRRRATRRRVQEPARKEEPTQVVDVAAAQAGAGRMRLALAREPRKLVRSPSTHCESTQQAFGQP